ncbi:type II toxin-antitoxin system HicB family antitoxin [Myceligenerans xiligouense]|uniref:type II toxin-antitoxin system HicB family antitoxin n=1 Tax=Myceligenerans xiligouense TaxID=253184 RepID=UPI001FEBA9F8|nr:type II toxin-antitoxin system HicB family antitoxin [Myceligenerans xiligouense]
MEALEGILGVVAEVIEDLEASNEPVPAPIAERHYSGKFVVRIPPETHRRLAVEAAEQHVSLNRFVADRLAMA